MVPFSGRLYLSEALGAVGLVLPGAISEWQTEGRKCARTHTCSHSRLHRALSPHCYLPHTATAQGSHWLSPSPSCDGFHHLNGPTPIYDQSPITDTLPR